MGIPINKVIAVVYGLGAALGVIGGILFCSYYQFIFIGIGFSYGTMKAWMATIWGGICWFRRLLFGRYGKQASCAVILLLTILL